MSAELNHLKYVYAVAKHRSFTKAARALRISQPGISRVVTNIEESYGSKLFDRTKKGVVLTKTGEIFLNHCENIFNEVKNLDEEARAQNSECTGVLSLAASDNIANHLLPVALFAFWRKNSKILIKLFSGTSDQIKNELLENRSELGLFYAPIRSQELELKKLADVEFVVVCAPGTNLLLEPKSAINGLMQDYYIGSRPEEYKAPYPALKLLQSIGVKPRQFFEVNSNETQKNMAKQGLGYTVIPKHAAAEELKSGTLSVVPIQRKLFWPIYLAKKRNRTLTRTAEAFASRCDALFPMLVRGDSATL